MKFFLIFSNSHLKTNLANSILFVSLALSIFFFSNTQMGMAIATKTQSCSNQFESFIPYESYSGPVFVFVYTKMGGLLPLDEITCYDSLTKHLVFIKNKTNPIAAELTPNNETILQNVMINNNISKITPGVYVPREGSADYYEYNLVVIYLERLIIFIGSIPLLLKRLIKELSLIAKTIESIRNHIIKDTERD